MIAQVVPEKKPYRSPSASPARGVDDSSAFKGGDRVKIVGGAKEIIGRLATVTSYDENLQRFLVVADAFPNAYKAFKAKNLLKVPTTTVTDSNATSNTAPCRRRRLDKK